jgi:2-dehydropantoate 2-reductase
MRFVMMGAGAIGGVVGGQLAKASFETILVDPLRPHVEAINRDGLRLRGVHGAHVLRIPAVTDLTAAGLRADDAVICAVKSYHTDAAIQALRRAAGPDARVFCAQNGVRNEEVAARYLGHVHGVMLLFGAKRLVPGEVVHTNSGPIGIGCWPSGLCEVAREVAEALGKTDIPAYATEEIAVHKWNKMVLNLNNATAGLLGLSGQEARNDPEVRAWMADVCGEGVRALRAAGIRFEGPPGLGSVEARIQELRGPMTVAVPADEEGKQRPSLWQDLYHGGGAVEADWFNGEIVRLGRQHGVSTPLNGLLLELITEMARARERPGKFTLRELRARLAR